MYLHVCVCACCSPGAFQVYHSPGAHQVGFAGWSVYPRVSDSLALELQAWHPLLFCCLFGSGRSNSGIHTYAARTLPSELSPHSLVFLFFYNAFYSTFNYPHILKKKNPIKKLIHAYRNKTFRGPMFLKYLQTSIIVSSLQATFRKHYLFLLLTRFPHLRSLPCLCLLLRVSSEFLFRNSVDLSRVSPASCHVDSPGVFPFLWLIFSVIL